MQETEKIMIVVDDSQSRHFLQLDKSQNPNSPRIKPKLLKKSRLPKPRFHITNFSSKLTPSLIQKVENLHRSVEVKKPTIVIKNVKKQTTPGYHGGLFQPNPGNLQSLLFPNSHRKYHSSNNILESFEANERDTSDFKLRTIRDGLPSTRENTKHNRLETEFSKTCDNLQRNMNSFRGKMNVGGYETDVLRSNRLQSTDPIKREDYRQKVTHRSRLAPHQSEIMAKSKLSKPLWVSSSGVPSNHPNKNQTLHLTVGPSNTYEFEINETRLRNRFLEYRKENSELIQSVRNELESKHLSKKADERAGLDQREGSSSKTYQFSSKQTPWGYFDLSSAKKYPEKESDIILVTHSMSPSKSSKNLTGKKQIGEKSDMKGSQAKQKLLGSSNSLLEQISTPETTTIQAESLAETKRVSKPVVGIAKQKALPTKQRLLLYSLKYEPLDALATLDSAKKKGGLNNILQAGLSNLLSGLPEPTQITQETAETAISSNNEALVRSLKDKEPHELQEWLHKHKPYYVTGLAAAQSVIDQRMRQQESRAAFNRKLSQESRGEILSRMAGVSQHFSEHTAGGFMGSFGTSESPKYIRQDMPYPQYKLRLHEEAFEQLMCVLQQQQGWRPVDSEELQRKKVVLRHWEFMLEHSKYQREFGEAEDYRRRPLLFLDLDETLVSTLTSKKRKPGYALLKDPTVDTVYVGFLSADTSAPEASLATIPSLGSTEFPFGIICGLYSRLCQGSTQGDRS